MLSPHEYRQLVESSPTMIWRADSDMRRTYVNPVWLAFTGRPADQELGSRWTAGIHPDDRPRCTDVYVANLEARRPFELEYRLRRHDGVYRYIFDRAVPFRDDRGELAGFIGSCVDIDDRRRASASHHGLLSMFAHELRTPLQSLMNYLELFRVHTSDGKRVPDEVLDRFGDQIQRFGRLIRNLTDFTRQDIQELPLDLAEIDLGELARETVAEIAGPMHGAHRYRVHDRGRCRIKADRKRIAQLLGNLLDNARKYSPDGGEIEVITGPTPRGGFIEVTDQGIGIPHDEIHALTQRYFRARNASPWHYPGMGLGLSICARIVERHSGQMEFESQLNRGTRVTVRLPSEPELAP